MRTFIRNINPFKEREDNSKLEYIIQKVLVFL